MRVALLVLLAVPLAAQEPDSRMIRGTVVDSTGRRLPWVYVQTSGQGKTVSNDSGQFSYKTDGKGDVELRVFRLGYQPTTVKINPSADTTISVTLRGIPRVLESVEIESNRVSRRLQSNGFYDRMEGRQKGLGSGTFFTREDIEQRRPLRITQMIEGVNGVRITRTMQPLSTRSASNRTGSPGTAQLPPSSMEDFVIEGPNRCTYNVYLDGTLISPKQNLKTGINAGLAIDPLLSPNATAAVEIYPRGPGVPARYANMGESCGVVLFWSR